MWVVFEWERTRVKIWNKHVGGYKWSEVSLPEVKLCLTCRVPSAAGAPLKRHSTTLKHLCINQTLVPGDSESNPIDSTVHWLRVHPQSISIKTVCSSTWGDFKQTLLRFEQSLKPLSCKKAASHRHFWSWRNTNAAGSLIVLHRPQSLKEIRIF